MRIWSGLGFEDSVSFNITATTTTTTTTTTTAVVVVVAAAVAVAAAATTTTTTTTGAEGSDRRGRTAQLPHLPAQRRRQHPQDVRPRTSPGSVGWIRNMSGQRSNPADDVRYYLQYYFKR